MSLRRTDNAVSSDKTEATALYEPDGLGWTLSWGAGGYTRNQAIGCVMLEAVATMQAEGAVGAVTDHSHRLWPRMDTCADELGVTGPQAVSGVSEWSLG